MLLKTILLLLLSVTPVTSVEVQDKETECMAKNIFYEAGNQSLEGKIAVAYVTHNRTLDDRFPENICSVVYQKNQFSWTGDREYQRRHGIKPTDYRWAESKYAATNFLLYPDRTKGSVFFHEKSIKPNWNMKIIRTTYIGNHVFYRF